MKRDTHWCAGSRSEAPAFSRGLRLPVLALCGSLAVHALAAGVYLSWSAHRRSNTGAKEADPVTLTLVRAPEPQAVVAKVEPVIAPLPASGTRPEAKEEKPPAAEENSPATREMTVVVEIREERKAPEPPPAAVPEAAAKPVERSEAKAPAPLEQLPLPIKEDGNSPTGNVATKSGQGEGHARAKAAGTGPGTGVAAGPVHASGNGERGDEGAVSAAPAYRKNPAPKYPAAARWRRDEGVVVLKVLVSDAGRATGVEVKRTSGSAALDEAALKAVRRWEFEPARLGKRAVTAEVEVKIRFKLEEQ